LGVLGAAALSLVVMLVHGLVDDVLYGSRAVLLLFVPLAFAAPVLQKQANQARRRAVLALPVAIILLMTLALVWRGPVLALVSSNLGTVHQSQTELSVYSWPEWPIQDAVRRAADLSQPITEFERALALDPANATANRRLGMIELSLGEYEDALGHLEAAYAAEPQSEVTQQLYGEALIVNGRVKEGRALWAKVSNEQGQFDARAYWYRSIGDEERATWVEQAASNR
jgi:tetratricopeptide (TPR) repeat protein